MRAKRGSKANRTYTTYLKEKREEYAMLSEFYRLAGLNTRGNEPKIGWVSGADGLTNLRWNAILDPDYEPPETPARLTMRELKELL